MRPRITNFLKFAAVAALLTISPASLYAGAVHWHTAIFGGLEDATQLLDCLPVGLAAMTKVTPYYYQDEDGALQNYIAATYPVIHHDCSDLSATCRALLCPEE